VEHITSLRAIPGLDVVRPADANEAVWAWRLALEHTDRPTALCLTRQNLPVLDRTELAPASNVALGGYTLAEASGGQPAVILIGTGSEVTICLTARERLEADGIPTRVVSMPCQEWFRAQDSAYRAQILPPSVKARVSVEAGIAMSWHDLVGEAGESVSLEHYGASAPYQVIFEQFGFTPDHVVAAARASISRASGIVGETTGN
jgi:transketolase